MYEFNTMKINLNMDVLSGMFNDYWYYHGEYKRFCKWWEDHRYTRTYYERREYYDNEYKRIDHEDTKSYEKIRDICEFMNLDMDTVQAVFKSIRRNCQYQNGWNREARFSSNRHFYFDSKVPGSIESFLDLCRDE